ncbi:MULTISPECIES: hypothetical protein [unclassified Thioalkalivibrio]|uniref:hypothetical protein n=1 Tax=unclassified Thioalkalivibrio TaxID=2621013 RepID=UPI00037B8C45|nr:MULTISPECIES: hypothetical protein [unclassified Thioalkalivibrio]
MNGRKLPPYARRHAEALRHPPHTVWIAAGPNAWKWARQRPSHVVLVAPPEEDPAALDWRMCRGHDPVLVILTGPTEGAKVRELIGALLRDGVERVLDESGTLFIPEVRNG